MNVTEKQILERYLGWEYLHHGREEGKVDCWGLIIDVYKTYKGIKVLDLENYEKNWALHNKNLFIENYYKSWVQVEKPKLLDVILFYSSKDVVFHAGIYLSGNQFLHGTRAGVVIGRLIQHEWKSRVEGYYRYEC